MHDHPLDAQRAASTREAASLVTRYRLPGRRNPDWAAVLANNPLFPRAQSVASGPGAGFMRSAQVAVDTYARHQRAEREMERRSTQAEALKNIQLTDVRTAMTRAGYPIVRARLYNGSGLSVRSLTMVVHYVNSRQIVFSDEGSCTNPVDLGTGGTVEIACYLRQVPGATNVSLDIADVTWR